MFVSPCCLPPLARWRQAASWSSTPSGRSASEDGARTMYDAQARAVATDLMQLRTAQQGYVAQGQGTDFWMQRAAEHLSRVDRGHGVDGGGREGRRHADGGAGGEDRARELSEAGSARAAVCRRWPGADGVGRHLQREPRRGHRCRRTRGSGTRQRAGGARQRDHRAALAAALRSGGRRRRPHDCGAAARADPRARSGRHLGVEGADRHRAEAENGAVGDVVSPARGQCSDARDGLGAPRRAAGRARARAVYTAPGADQRRPRRCRPRRRRQST